MALLSGETFIYFLVLSFTFSLLCPSSASQPTQPSNSGAGSGGGPESGQMYVVAPTLEDCPIYNDTHCQTLPYYIKKYTNDLSNVVFWFLPGTHNLSLIWSIKNSRNVTLLGGNNLTNNDKSSEGMSKIVCHGSSPGGISVSKSNFTVIENFAIAYCTYALIFDATVNATVRNVNITHSLLSLEVSECRCFTLTKSSIEFCINGIYVLGSPSSEISNSQIRKCLFSNFMCVLNGGSITINQIISDGSYSGLQFEQRTAKISSLAQKSSVKISNSRFIVRERSISAILVQLGRDQPIDIYIDSVSITGVNGSGLLGICITDYMTQEAGSKPIYRTALIHNVTIENLGQQPNMNFTATPAAIYLLSLRDLTISDCTIKNNGLPELSYLRALLFFRATSP